MRPNTDTQTVYIHTYIRIAYTSAGGEFSSKHSVLKIEYNFVVGLHFDECTCVRAKNLSNACTEKWRAFVVSAEVYNFCMKFQCVTGKEVSQLK